MSSWVVRIERKGREVTTGHPTKHVSWWATTYRTKHDAETALRQRHGTVPEAARRGYTVQSAADAAAEQATLRYQTAREAGCL